MLKFWNYLSVLAENKERFLAKTAVAPLAGAWIEITVLWTQSTGTCVAPLAGAWIEMELAAKQYAGTMVAPLAGAWIEIRYLAHLHLLVFRRSPRGSVD